MPEVPILMPQLGESIAEATIIRLNVKVGDQVIADQEVIEVETNKATMGVTTLCKGTVQKLLVEEGVSYPVGTVLGLLDVTEEEAERTGVQGSNQAGDDRLFDDVERTSSEPVAVISPSVHHSDG